MAFAYSRQDRVYVQSETTLFTIPNSTGAATLAGTNYCRHAKINLTPSVGQMDVTYKTGNRSAASGYPGRKGGMWEYSGPWIPNGTGTTAPDIAPILKAIFGASPTIAGGQIPYVMTDSIASFSLWRFRGTVANVTQNHQVGLGCIVQQASWVIGQNFVDFSASGPCGWVLDREQYASVADADFRKGGLTTAGQAAFPAEPATQTANGNPTYGFVGTFVEGSGSTSIATLQTATITINTGNEHIADTFGSYYPSDVMGNERKVTISFSLYDGSDAAIADLRAASLSKAGVNLVLTVGDTTYNRTVFTIKGVQFPVPSIDDGAARFKLSFGESQAHPSALGLVDEFGMVIQ